MRVPTVHGGRWNSSGRAVVHMAESIALAVLENLVHMTRQDFPRGYVLGGRCASLVRSPAVTAVAYRPRESEDQGVWSA